MKSLVCINFFVSSAHDRHNVVGVGVEEEDRKHTWMEDAEAVSIRSNIPVCLVNCSVSL